MVNLCTEMNRSEVIAAILRSIPRSDEDAVSIHTLCPLVTEKLYPPCLGCTQALLTILQVFDVITVISNNAKGEIRVKAKSQTSIYFLRSLAMFVDKSLTLISNWEREGVDKESPVVDVFKSGAQFVYLMEHKRTDEHNELSPIRHEDVSQVVIKSKIRGRHDPVYLVQYDEKANQFQLIGGRKRSTDPDALTVMSREIDEELSQNHLKLHRDYELQELVSDLQSYELSNTYGAYSEYNFTIYQALIKRKQLALGQNDTWVTLSELRSGKTKKGIRISGKYIYELNKKLYGGLNGLPLSLKETQKRALSDVIRERKWELMSGFIGILGIIFTLLFSK